MAATEMDVPLHEYLNSGFRHVAAETFQRQELSRWLKDNGLSSVYNFDNTMAEVDANAERQLSNKERNNLYNIIGVLLAMLKHYGADEASVKKFVADQAYSDIPGLSVRNLEKVFPLARNAIL